MSGYPAPALISMYVATPAPVPSTSWERVLQYLNKYTEILVINHHQDEMLVLLLSIPVIPIKSSKILKLQLPLNPSPSLTQGLVLALEDISVMLIVSKHLLIFYYVPSIVTKAGEIPLLKNKLSSLIWHYSSNSYRVTGGKMRHFWSSQLGCYWHLEGVKAMSAVELPTMHRPLL